VLLLSQACWTYFPAQAGTRARASGEAAKLNVKGLPINGQWLIIDPKTKSLSRLAEAFKEHLVAKGIQ